MQAINEAMESVTTSGGNATVIENLAPFLKDQQDMVEATRDLVAKVTEFRGGFEAPGGLDEIQEQGKNIITEKINDLRVGINSYGILYDIYIDVIQCTGTYFLLGHSSSRGHH